MDKFISKSSRLGGGGGGGGEGGEGGVGGRSPNCGQIILKKSSRF